MMESVVKPRLAAALALVLAVLATACAHVGQEDFENEIAELRAQLAAQSNGNGNGTEGRNNAARIAALTVRVDGLTAALSDLEGQFDVTIERLEAAIRFDVPVHFAFDRDELRPEDLPVLARFGDVVSQYYPDALLTVEGFTDRSGSREYNLDLGQRRANAVRLYLVETAGFRRDRVRAVSYGEDPARLVYPEQAGPDVGIENRRVALVVDFLGAADSPTVLSGIQ